MYKTLTNPRPITSSISKYKKDHKKLQVEYTWTDTADLKSNTDKIVNYNYYKFFVANKSGFIKDFSEDSFSKVIIPNVNSTYRYVKITFQDDPLFNKLIRRDVAVQACGPVKNSAFILACSSAALANVKVSMGGIFNILLQSSGN